MKYNSWQEFFPELTWIGDKELQDLVISMYEEAMELGGYKTLDELAEAPFTLQFSYGDLKLRDHTRTVTILCRKAYEGLQDGYGPEICPLNFDLLIAGALVHDIGKVFEYEWDEQKKGYVMTERGNLVKHCFSGAGLAMRHDAPLEITHMIANHAAEGIGKYRSPEGVILNKCDYLSFDIVKAYLGMKQEH